MNGKIMVVDRSSLFGKGNEKFFEGFKLHTEIDYESIILTHHEWLERTPVETDPSHKQPIAYIVIVNPYFKLVFAYKRSAKDPHYPEKRLQGRWSWGVGGHIKPSDAKGKNPIDASLLRELNEEVGIGDKVELQILGYINSERDAVSQVHFGMLYIAKTYSTDIQPKDPEIEKGNLRPLREVSWICSFPQPHAAAEFWDSLVEEWSRIALEPLKRYFQNF